MIWLKKIFKKTTSLWSTQEKATAPAQSNGIDRKVLPRSLKSSTTDLEVRFSQWNLRASCNTQAVFNHGFYAAV